ncbi:T9SS type A sorting domain-containing protein [Taibaiella koreensis]|uniref:T9SS type A sorting domain-containing protein n=1 Tax=Taibaiella koreensis TaxID=1268548 RepID=UPI0013C34EE0|nr:T9SS type A sorting domain-containing protein [Taibaiella koreensis]
MKRKCSLLFSLIATLIVSCQVYSQSLSDRRWKIDNSTVISGTDTTELFDTRRELNIFDLDQIEYSFDENDHYVGANVDGGNIEGVWTQNQSEIVLDGVTSGFQWIDSTHFLLSQPLLLHDSTGAIRPAVSLIKFYYSPITSFQFTVFPNPMKSDLFIQLEAPKAFNASIGVRNMLGQTVSTYPITRFDAYSRISINVSNLPRGIYCVFVTGDNIAENKLISIL